MKNNKNNLKAGNYYLGLDVGTNSIGWAVTDENYNIPKFKGNAMGAYVCLKRHNLPQTAERTAPHAAALQDASKGFYC